MVKGQPQRFAVGHYLRREVSLAERFWEKVDRRADDECWLWLAFKNKGGYGQLKTRGTSIPAYRFAYELLVGPVPEGLELDHLCRNPWCVNPAHLEPVTHRVNILRGNTFGAVNAQKTHCPKGHPYSGDNLHLLKDGGRKCRTCNRESQQALRDRRQASRRVSEAPLRVKVA